MPWSRPRPGARARRRSWPPCAARDSPWTSAPARWRRSSGWRCTSSSARPRRCSAGARWSSEPRPTPPRARCAWASRGPCPSSTARPWSWGCGPPSSWSAASTPRASFTGRTTTTPTCRRTIRSPSTSTPATRGRLLLETPQGLRPVGIRRVHLEEDTGKLVHAEGRSLVDYNRSGTPLMEVVTEPDLRSPEEARQFLVQLRTLLQYAGVTTGRMEEGTLRCDANLSLRRPGGELGTRTEIKNMNSLRSVERALRYEEARQREVLGRGEPVVQETRHWDEDRGITFPSREKEEAQDYRYFPEPDLVPLRIDEAWIARVRSELPELPDARRRRYVEVFGLPEHDSRLVTATRALADFFEETVRLFPHPKTVSNWLVGEVAAYLNATGLEIEDIPLRPASLAELLALVDSGTLSGRSAKEVLEEMVRTGRSAREIVEERGLVQISDEAALDRIVQDVIAENPGPVADVRAGKDKAVTYLVGQVMKKTRGRANPELVNRLLRERLGAG